MDVGSAPRTGGAQLDRSDSEAQHKACSFRMIIAVNGSRPLSTQSLSSRVLPTDSDARDGAVLGAQCLEPRQSIVQRVVVEQLLARREVA